MALAEREREQLVRPDSKGRVTLKRFVKEGVAYSVSSDEEGRIVLEPVVQVAVPEREAWLFRNDKALAMVKQGLREAGEGKVTPLEPADLAEDDDE